MRYVTPSQNCIQSILFISLAGTTFDNFMYLVLVLPSVYLAECFHDLERLVVITVGIVGGEECHSRHVGWKCGRDGRCSDDVPIAIVCGAEETAPAELSCHDGYFAVVVVVFVIRIFGCVVIRCHRSSIVGGGGGGSDGNGGGMKVLGNGRGSGGCAIVILIYGAREDVAYVSFGSGCGARHGSAVC